jgi:hypothetical protein
MVRRWCVVGLVAAWVALSGGRAYGGVISVANLRSENADLVFEVSGTQALRLMRHTTCPNVVGGYGNSITGGVYGAAIGGGGAAGHPNRVTDVYGTIAGGRENQAGDNAGSATDKPYAAVGGGLGNTAYGEAATVGGGEINHAGGTHATVGGGWNNSAGGRYAVVPGGYVNTAHADHSFAAGRQAKAYHDGAFVWADSTATDIFSTGSNQFIVRASGGVWFGTTSSPSTPSGRFINTSTGGYLSMGGDWTNACDRDRKESFQAVDCRDVLQRLAELPIATWNYKAQDSSVRHIGPVAQDFRAAFGVGADDTHISTVDADGVALAAIQGLHRLVEERDAEIAGLRQRLARLEALVERLAQQQGRREK